MTMLILSLCSPIRGTSQPVKKNDLDLRWGFKIIIFFNATSKVSLCNLWLKGKRFFCQCRFRSFWIYPIYQISYLHMEIVNSKSTTTLVFCLQPLVNTCIALFLCTEVPHHTVYVLQYSYGGPPQNYLQVILHYYFSALRLSQKCYLIQVSPHYTEYSSNTTMVNLY